MRKNYSNEESCKIFCHNVSWLQAHHGLSNKKMAETLKISTATLNKIKNGEFPPRLGVEIFFYIGREFKIKPYDQLTVRLGD